MDHFTFNQSRGINQIMNPSYLDMVEGEKQVRPNKRKDPFKYDRAWQVWLAVSFNEHLYFKISWLYSISTATATGAHPQGNRSPPGTLPHFFQRQTSPIVRLPDCTRLALLVCTIQVSRRRHLFARIGSFRTLGMHPHADQGRYQFQPLALPNESRRSPHDVNGRKRAEFFAALSGRPSRSSTNLLHYFIINIFINHTFHSFGSRAI